MKQAFPTLWLSGVLAFVLALLLQGQPGRAADPKRGVEVDARFPPTEMTEGKQVKLSFPSPMVSEEAVGAGQAASPVEWIPAVGGTWVWESQTEGTFTLGKGIRPDTHYLLRLKDGLLDLDSKKPTAADTLLALTSPRFRLSSRLTFAEGDPEQERINLLRVSLSFSYAVSAPQVAELVYFQDRDNRRRYPVKVHVPREELTTKNLEVMARDPLPPKRTFDLIVEGIEEPGSGYRQPIFSVIPLDVAVASPPDSRPQEPVPLRVKRVSSSNLPLKQPTVRIEFDQHVPAAEGAKVRFNPAVEGLTFSAQESTLLVSGSFKNGIRYAVEIPVDLTGAGGSHLPETSRWGASFQAKRGAIVFPAGESVYKRRASLGVQFPFVQVNATNVRWRLAKIPPEKTQALQSRLLEFRQSDRDLLTGDPLVDPITEESLFLPTELLVDSSRLEVLAEGAFTDAPEDAEVQRVASWTPSGQGPEGPCLLEIQGRDAKGRVVGNRALIWFTEFSVLKKVTEAGVVLRAVRYEDGSPLQNVRVVSATHENVRIAEGRTDENGVVRFTQEEVRKAGFFLFVREGALVTYPASGFSYLDQGYSFLPPVPQTRAELVTDRPLYRPEHTVKFKGFVRDTADLGSNLVVPAPRKLTVQIRWIGDDAAVMQTTGVTTDAFGGFEGEWKVPPGAPLGSYSLTLLAPDNAGTPYARKTIAVEEFRPPSFTVDLEQLQLPGEASAVLVKSTLFHGAPNAGAKVKWTARWKAAPPEHPGYNSDRELEGGALDSIELVQGEAQLGPDGTVELTTLPPFKDGAVRGWFKVFWEVEVTGFDAQSVTEPLTASVFAAPVFLGAEATERKDKAVEIHCFALNPQQQPAEGTAIRVELAGVKVKTASIQLAPNVFRRENTTVFEREAVLEGVTPFRQTVYAKAQGKYRISVSAVGKAAVPKRELSLYVTGSGSDAPAEFKPETEAAFKMGKDKESYFPGDTALLSLQAPFAGQAWVSVEAAGNILKQFPIRLEGNSGKLELPVTKDFYPNVWVSVHLLRPAPAGGVPAEKVASIELSVKRPDLELEVTPVLKSAEVEPGADILGELSVRVQGQPVADADVTLYAVDDALLVAGAWKPPTLFTARSDRRPRNVTTLTNLLSALEGQIATHALTQKGFIIGDGDDDAALAGKKKVRKDFLPLATWQTGLRTDAAGKLRIQFKAPDSLTRYRLVALVQTRESQFGVGLASVEVAKSIQIEPALPRFLREGDEVELRAVVRQKSDANLDVELLCQTSLTLTGKPSISRGLSRNAPAVFVFKARVGEATSAKIGFSTKSGAGDAVEMELPVFPPTLLQHEMVFGTLQTNSVSDGMKEKIPEKWNKARGAVTLSLSASEWLPQLSALPLVLDYPHGCGEQISTRVLAYTLMGDVLAFLPDDGAHEQVYRKRVEYGLAKLGAWQLPDGGIPYWGGGSSEFPFVTVHAYWAASQAAAQEWSVPEDKLELLRKRVAEIALGKTGADPSVRCYALMVLAGVDARIGGFEPVIKDLYFRRGKLPENRWFFEAVGDEARAFLAVAMHRWNVLPAEKETLLREINRTLPEHWFDQRTFSSPVRASAVRLWAEAIIQPDKFKGAAARGALESVARHLKGGSGLSTQENFWTLLTFKTLLELAQVEAPAYSEAQPAPVALSKNKASARWSPEPLSSVHSFSPALPGTSLAGLTCMLEADFRMQSASDEQRTDRGFRVERVVVNRTDPTRRGTRDNPYQLGDELGVNFRIRSDQMQYYVALEGELPACFESVNTRLPSVAGAGDSFEPTLSNVELRDKTTCFYFDALPPGPAVFQTSVRVTSAGTFHWPATQITPMYDGRFSGTSASSMCYVVEK